jgi:parallel beta-helix repeat protein
VGSSLSAKVESSTYSNVTVSEAVSMISSNPSLVILDVRTQSEYDSGHIRNAKLIPSTELSSRLDELNETDQILVYCLSGGRSAAASQTLVDNGFLNIYNMLGGITAWIGAGHPTYIKYSSIQEAINNANEGDSLHISSGTYFENIVINKSVSIFGENKDTTAIDGGRVGSVVEVTSNNVVFNGFSVKNSSLETGTSHAGIKISGANGCSIADNFVMENRFGIFAFSQGTGIQDNVVIDNNQGVVLYSSFSMTIEKNNVSRNTVGISLAYCHDNIVLGNDVKNSSAGGHGIIISSDSFNNSVVSNEIFNNYHGMWLSNSHNNSILRNTMINNSLLGIELAESSDNILFKNNFVGNPKHFVIDDFSVNLWDDSCEGNYWDNYNGTDSDDDGVGETAYIINQNNTDRHPLINFQWSPCDINHDWKVDMRDVGSAARAFGTEPGDERWNCHADITGPIYLVPDKKVDMRDIGLVARYFGETYT